jgi:hypothetical protein
MTKILITAAIIGAFAFALSVVGLSAWRAWDHRQEEKAVEDSGAPSSNRAVAAKEKSDEALARYTLWLTIFTAVLAFVALVQIGFLITADQTAADAAEAAKNSAEAAKQSANAVVNVERPFFFVLAKPVATVPKDATDQAAPNIAYTITNMGRVPAIIHLLYADCRLLDVLPPKQTIDGNKIRPGLMAIGAGALHADTPQCEFDKRFTPEDWNDIRLGKKAAIFEAIFAYEGALDFTYVTSVLYRIDLFTGQAFAFGGSAYNYDDVIPGRLSKTDRMIFSRAVFSNVPTESSKKSAP